MKKLRFSGITTLAAIIVSFVALSLTACPPESDPIHEHQWGAWRQTRAPTCTTAGEETKTCTLDATHIEIQSIPIDPKAHNYGNWAETTAPTCTTAGEESGTCAYNNSHITTRAVAVLGHDYQNWTQTTAPTCTTEGEETGTCTRDAATTTRAVAALGHDYGNWTQTTAPTCTTAGVDTGTCTRDAATTTRSVAVLGHNYQWTVTTPATETTDGIETEVCSRNSLHTNGTRTVYATGTAGLAFELINSGINNGTYCVRKGTVTTGEVHIPAYHRQDSNSEYLPVTEIGSSTDGSSLDKGAFYNTSITSVTIPETVTFIRHSAFRSCNSLATITIPASVTFIESAFTGCSSLVSITVDTNNLGYASEGGILYNKEKTTLIAWPSASGSITIPEGVMYIVDFIEYTSIVSVAFPASVTGIGYLAFLGCTSLTSITFAENSLLTTIAQSAFWYCTSLTSVTFPASVTTIIQNAFSDCTSLTSVTFEGTIPSSGFTSVDSFPGDLRTKFYATDSANGTPGTYTRPNGTSTTWTRQP